jgi:DNA-binding response OmpR family regulator
MEATMGQTQRKRIAELTAEVERLKEALYATSVQMKLPRENVRLSTYENRLLHCFAQRRTVNVVSAIVALYYDCDLGDLPVSEHATISVLISRLRKKLAPFKIVIYNVKGEGWYVDEKTQQKLRGWYDTVEDKTGDAPSE